MSGPATLTGPRAFFSVSGFANIGLSAEIAANDFKNCELEMGQPIHSPLEARLVTELDRLDLISRQIETVKSERDALNANASETSPLSMLGG